MKLVVDIGNTRLKWGVIEDGYVIADGWCSAKDVVGAERPTGLGKYLESSGLIQAVWISHVGDSSVLDWLTLNWCQGLPSEKINVVKVNQSVAGLQNSYKHIDKLGVDRWVAALGARSIELEGDLLVIDAGTAVTIDWVSAENVFEGGVILPGAKLMHDALTNNTAGIQSEYRDTVQIVGKSTSECVNSGVGYGLVGAVERVVFEMEKVINRPVKILLTGGAAAVLQARLRVPVSVHPDLVLSGLTVLAEQGELA